MPEHKSIEKSPASTGRTSRLTPEQHRRIAEIYRKPDEQETPQEAKLAEEIAAQHEALARMIERRATSVAIRTFRRVLFTSYYL